MRKLLGVLICFSLALTATNTVEAKTKPKPKQKKVATFPPAVIEAITKRAIAETREVLLQFQKEDPDIEAMLKFYDPRYRSTYRKNLTADIARGDKFVETRSTPLEVERVISIKRKSATIATVDFCYASSLYNPIPGEVVELDKGTYPIYSGRETQEWTLLGTEWFESTRITRIEYSKDTECAEAN
jgi:hypothetical protein